MITATFTDPQGQTWTDARIKVINFNMNCNSSLSVYHNNNLNEPVERSDMNTQAHMQIVYWPTQKAMDDGHPPYNLNNQGDEMDNKQFRFQLNSVPKNAAELETACEAHLVEVILPPMQS
jgi:hypothetical protein